MAWTLPFDDSDCHLGSTVRRVGPASRLVGLDGERRGSSIHGTRHGGHREFDLAMMHLFGGYGSEVIDGYQEVSALADGWQDRIELHQDRAARRPRDQVRRELRRCSDPSDPSLRVIRST